MTSVSDILEAVARFGQNTIKGGENKGKKLHPAEALAELKALMESTIPEKRHKDYKVDTPNLSSSSQRRQKSINFGYNIAVEETLANIRKAFE